MALPALLQNLTYDPLTFPFPIGISSIDEVDAGFNSPV
jgi:hypothetical protein